MRYQRFGFMKNKTGFGDRPPFVPLSVSVTEDMTGNDRIWGADGTSDLDARSRLNYSNISYAIDTNRPNATLYYEFIGNVTTSDFADTTIAGNVVLDANGNATLSKSITSNVELGDTDFQLRLKKKDIGDTVYTGNQKYIYKVEPPNITGGDIQTITTQSGVDDITLKSRIHIFDNPLTGNVNYTISRGYNEASGGWTGDYIIFNEPFTTAGDVHTFSGVTDPNWTFLNGNSYVLRAEFSGATLYDLSNTSPIIQAPTFNLSLTGNAVTSGPTAETLTVVDTGTMGSNVYNIIFTGTVNTPAGDDNQTAYFNGAGNGANKIHTLVVGAGGDSLGGSNVSNAGGGGGNVSSSAVEIIGFTANTAYNMIPGFSNTATHQFGPGEDSWSSAYDNDANLKIDAVGGQPSTNTISGGVHNGGSSGLHYVANVFTSITFNGGSGFDTITAGGGAGFGSAGGNSPNSTTGGNGGNGKSYVTTSGALTYINQNPFLDYSNTTGYANVGVSAGGGGKGSVTDGVSGFTGNVDFGTGAPGGGFGASNGVILVRYAYSDPFRFISNTEIT